MKTDPPSRTLTTLAVGFVLLDGVLLVYAGAVLHRTALIVAGAVCGVLSIAVIYGWRRYRRAMAELAAARREMREHVEAMRDLLQKHHTEP